MTTFFNLFFIFSVPISAYLKLRRRLYLIPRAEAAGWKYMVFCFAWWSMQAMGLVLRVFFGQSGGIKIFWPFQVIWLTIDVDWNTFVRQQLQPLEDSTVKKNSRALQLKLAAAGIASPQVMEISREDRVGDWWNNRWHHGQCWWNRLRILGQSIQRTWGQGVTAHGFCNQMCFNCFFAGIDSTLN